MVFYKLMLGNLMVRKKSGCWHLAEIFMKYPKVIEQVTNSIIYFKK
jgi:hypothetical protein